MKWVVALFAFSFICGAAGAQDEDPKSAIMAVEEKRTTALMAADTVALDTILAGEFTVTNPDGVTWAKHEYLMDLATGALKIDSLRALTNDVIVYDRTATVQGRISVTATIKGTTRSFEAKSLRVYVYRKERWVLVAQQMTRVG